MSLKKLFWAIIILAMLGGIGYGVFYYIKDKNAWKIEVVVEELHVRKEHNLYEAQVGTIYEGDKYNVLEIYLDDPRYVWYKIKLSGKVYGWVASGRNNNYVNEINNPNVTDYEEGESYKLDYKKPVVKFDDNVYVVYDLKSINYDHLTIEDESEFTIEHKVYYEEDPVDTDIPQYWIQYIVTDTSGNQTRIVQQIKFDIEPDPSEVLSFEKDFVR